jgi:hypothetical protein
LKAKGDPAFSKQLLYQLNTIEALATRNQQVSELH